MNNVITAVFGGRRDIVLPARYRYDYGQVLRIAGISGLPDVYEVHFGNSGTETAYRALVSGSQVTIPDELFETGLDVWFWVYVHESAADGTTVYRARIPVNARPKPEDYEPTPAQTGIIEDAIELLNREIADIENAHNNAVAAQTAQAAAETAQSAAETAQSAAETAQTAAESARDLAEGYSSNADAKASQAAQSASDAAAAKTAAEAAATLAEEHNMGVSLSGNTLVFASRLGESTWHTLIR